MYKFTGIEQLILWEIIVTVAGQTNIGRPTVAGTLAEDEEVTKPQIVSDKADFYVAYALDIRKYILSLFMDVLVILKCFDQIKAMVLCFVEHLLVVSMGLSTFNPFPLSFEKTTRKNLWTEST